jgi:hypothetical protein
MQDTFILSSKEKLERAKEEKRKYDQVYRAKNKLKLSEQWKSYDQRNKVEVRARKRKYVKQRRATDPIFRLRHNVSKSIRAMMKLNKNDNSCKQYLPFSMDELKIHLENQFEPWMNWNNHGKYNSKTWNDNDPSTWTWQLDHIVPQSDLPYVSMKDENFKKCWSLDNLRPLNAKQNLIDGVTKARHNFGGGK